MTNEPIVHALIYNRVSSLQQELDGSGLFSQQQRCIKYAESKGYIVSEERIFNDTFSGGGDFMRRPAMSNLLAYIDSNPGETYVVIFDDLKRFARDTKFHIELRSAFSIRGVKVECLNFNFEETPEGTFVETILAAQNQLEREQNRRQVIQKQKSRLELGYWAFSAPVGYSMQKASGFAGKVAIPSENANVLKEALEGFADLKFTYLVDVARFLKNHGVLGSAPDERYIETVRSFLENPFYAGFIEYKKWGVERRKGMHQPIITESTYRKNLARLERKASITRIRKDDNEEFELRRLLNCMYCNRPFTAAFSKGRNQSYPYYLCQMRGCPMHKKAIPRNVIDTMFKSAMEGLKPTNDVIQSFQDLFEECWNEAIKNIRAGSTRKSEEIAKLEEEVSKYVRLAGQTTIDSVRLSYENEIERLTKDLQLLYARSPVRIDLSIPYRTALERVMRIAKNPYESWVSCKFSEKKKLFYFFFEENIEFDVKRSYRTAKPSILYAFFGDLAENSANVERPGNLSKHFPALFEFVQKWGRHFQVGE